MRSCVYSDLFSGDMSVMQCSSSRLTLKLDEGLFLRARLSASTPPPAETRGSVSSRDSSESSVLAISLCSSSFQDAEEHDAVNDSIENLPTYSTPEAGDLVPGQDDTFTDSARTFDCIVHLLESHS
jgi:hypothetical protein